MRKKFHFSYTQSLLIVIFVLILDQATKYIARTTLDLGQSVHVIGRFFMLTYVENPGMAFGIRFDNTFVFLAMSLVAAGLVFYYFHKLREEAWPLQLAMALIAAGAIGNLADRFIRGSVVDFFDFEFWDVTLPGFHFLGLNFPGYHMTRWPVFNIADMAVSSGMIIIFIFLFLQGRSAKKTTQEAIDPHG